LGSSQARDPPIGSGSDGGPRPGEGGLVGADPQHGHHLRPDGGRLGGQPGPAGPQLLGPQLGGARGGPLDQVGDPQPEGQQLGLLVGGELPWGQPAQVQRLPEPVPGPGEVVPDRRRPQPRINAAEQHLQTVHERIGN
jgi:hypothetical protein